MDPTGRGACSVAVSSQPVTIDDATLGYSAKDVLAAINQSAVGDLIWFDGTQTKLRFDAQFARDQPISVVNPPPNAGFCYRSMNFNILASITTDDGRWNEALDGSVAVTDRGSRFVVDDVSVNLNAISGPKLAAISIAKRRICAGARGHLGVGGRTDALTRGQGGDVFGILYAWANAFRPR